MLFAKLKGLVKILAYFINAVIWSPVAFIMNGFEGVKLLHNDFVDYCKYEWNRIREEELKSGIAEYNDKMKVCQHFKVEAHLDYDRYPDSITVKIRNGEVGMRKSPFSKYNSIIFYSVSDEASPFFGVTIAYDELVRLNASFKHELNIH
jgi:hypothetical protein